jgi:hypothetical protein
MKGVQIFTHSVRQLTNNLPAALRISGVLYLVQFVAALLFGGAMMSGDMGSMGAAGFGIGAILVLLISLVTGVWIAVAWHRYVLLAENPATVLPALMTDKMTAYFLRSLMIAILVIIAAAVLGMIASFIAMPLMMNGAGMIGFLVIALIVQLPLIFVGFRLATTLPGAALGENHSFMAGWEATQADWKAIFQLSVIAALAMWAINIIGLYVFGGYGILAQIWQLIAGWPVMMVGLSILTTLYGHYIEKRPLV